MKIGTTNTQAGNSKSQSNYMSMWSVFNVKFYLLYKNQWDMMINILPAVTMLKRYPVAIARAGCISVTSEPSLGVGDVAVTAGAVALGRVYKQ
jgi:hypothetical protein